MRPFNEGIKRAKHGCVLVCWLAGRQGRQWNDGKSPDPGREVSTVTGTHYTGVSVMFGIGLFTLWLVLAGYSIRDLSAKTILTITGHLRARPDPWLESALRTAFAEFDRELAVILQDRSGPVRARTDHAGRPASAANPESSRRATEPPPSSTR
jgi:hypothetical protein